MLLSHRKNDLTSVFKEVTGLQGKPPFGFPRVEANFETVYNVQMDAAVGGQTAGGPPKASPRRMQPLFAVPALRELESACRVSILPVPTVCFSGALRGSPERVSSSLRPKPYLLGKRPCKNCTKCWYTLGPFLL